MTFAQKMFYNIVFSPSHHHPKTKVSFSLSLFLSFFLSFFHSFSPSSWAFSFTSTERLVTSSTSSSGIRLSTLLWPSHEIQTADRQKARNRGCLCVDPSYTARIKHSGPPNALASFLGDLRRFQNRKIA